MLSEVKEYIKNIYKDVLDDPNEVDRYVEVFEDRMLYEIESGEVKGVAFFLWLTDEYVDLIRNGDKDLRDVDDFKDAMKNEGDNAHFFSLTLSDSSLLRKRLKEFIEHKNPKTISWIGPHGNGFKLIRNKDYVH